MFNNVTVRLDHQSPCPTLHLSDRTHKGGREATVNSFLLAHVIPNGYKLFSGVLQQPRNENSDNDNSSVNEQEN